MKLVAYSIESLLNSRHVLHTLLSVSCCPIILLSMASLLGFWLTVDDISVLNPNGIFVNHRVGFDGRFNSLR